LIPVFFVSSGVTFDLHALFHGAGALVRIPVFLLVLLAVRGVPAMLYRPLLGTRRAAAAGLLQATSLPFIVTATQIGLALRAINPTNASALVAAGLLSVLIFPVSALQVLRGAETPQQEPGVHPSEA